MAKKRKQKKTFKFILKIVISFVLLVGLSLGGVFYKAVYWSNIKELNQDNNFLYIPSDAKFDDVIEIIRSKNLLVNLSSFRWTAEVMNYSKHIYPGKYRVEKGMSNRDLLLMLRTGKQEEVKIMFGKIRGKRKLAKYFADNLEVDYEEMYSMLTDPYYQKDYGFTPHTIMSMFIPNTYNFNWNTNAKMVFDRMYGEYKKFWTSSRISKVRALDLGLTKIDIITLASIVEEETYMNVEKPKIAGVYLNRLRKGMKLQADPTVRFAVGDFNIKRVLNKHLRIESPYNTYKYKGLPPGPICIPSIKSVDAVLNPASHDFLYFCAKPDFSGYHNFANNYAQHLRYARMYQKKLKSK